MIPASTYRQLSRLLWLLGVGMRKLKGVGSHCSGQSAIGKQRKKEAMVSGFVFYSGLVILDLTAELMDRYNVSLPSDSADHPKLLNYRLMRP